MIDPVPAFVTPQGKEIPQHPNVTETGTVMTETVNVEETVTATTIVATGILNLSWTTPDDGETTESGTIGSRRDGNDPTVSPFVINHHMSLDGMVLTTGTRIDAGLALRIVTDVLNGALAVIGDQEVLRRKGKTRMIVETVSGIRRRNLHGWTLTSQAAQVEESLEGRVQMVSSTGYRPGRRG